jgi:thiol-disulfide isomerase/thioredoxin
MVAGIVLVSVAVVSAVVVAVSRGSGDSARAMTTAEEFDLPALRGDGRVRLADEAGRPVVVNFFASWCTTCEAELPEFRRLAGDLAGEVSFVFVNSNDRGNGTDMATRHGLFDFAVARDIGGDRGDGLYHAVGARRGMPVTAFFDAEGRLVDLHLGGLLDGALEQKVEQLYG